MTSPFGVAELRWGLVIPLPTWRAWRLEDEDEASLPLPNVPVTSKLHPEKRAVDRPDSLTQHTRREAPGGEAAEQFRLAILQPRSLANLCEPQPAHLGAFPASSPPAHVSFLPRVSSSPLNTTDLKRSWMPRRPLLSLITLTALCVLIFATFFPRLQTTVASFRLFSPLRNLSNRMTTQGARRTPVYFVSHGGPNTMYEKDHPVYPRLQAIGKEITTQVKPKAIVVFSAHWQAQRPNTIEVNVSEQEPLLYDFYGFPKHYYMEKFPNRGSKEISQRVIDVLGEAGIKTETEERGLDHGVFVPFKIMFSPEDNPIDVPIVQVSLFDDDTNAEAHIKLGRAVEKLRDENILIIVSGMSVHNLREFMMLRMMGGQARPYAVSFDRALKEAAETAPGEERDKNMIHLLKRSDARQAHPTFEHLIPIHVGVGAAGQDQGKQLWTLPEMSMGWAQYRFGEVSA